MCQIGITVKVIIFILTRALYNSKFNAMFILLWRRRIIIIFFLLSLGIYGYLLLFLYGFFVTSYSIKNYNNIWYRGENKQNNKKNKIRKHYLGVPNTFLQNLCIFQEYFQILTSGYAVYSVVFKEPLCSFFFFFFG